MLEIVFFSLYEENKIEWIFHVLSFHVRKLFLCLLWLYVYINCFLLSNKKKATLQKLFSRNSMYCLEQGIDQKTFLVIPFNYKNTYRYSKIFETKFKFFWLSWNLIKVKKNFFKFSFKLYNTLNTCNAARSLNYLIYRHTCLLINRRLFTQSYNT